MPLSNCNKVLLPIMIFFIFIGCKKRSRDILPMDKMKVVFLHQMMAEEMVNLHFANKDTVLNLDSIYITSFERVLKVNRTDSAVFFKSLTYYKSDIERFKELLDSTHAYANKLRQDAYQAKDTSTTKNKKTADEKNPEGLQDKQVKAKDKDSLVN